MNWNLFWQNVPWGRNKNPTFVVMRVPLISATFSVNTNNFDRQAHMNMYLCIEPSEWHLIWCHRLSCCLLPLSMPVWSHVDWISICLSWIWFDIFERSDRHFHESEYCFKLVSIIENTHSVSTQHPHQKLCSCGTFAQEENKTWNFRLFVYFSQFFFTQLALAAIITRKDTHTNTNSAEINEFQEIRKRKDTNTKKCFVLQQFIFFLVCMWVCCIHVVSHSFRCSLCWNLFWHRMSDLHFCSVHLLFTVIILAVKFWFLFGIFGRWNVTRDTKVNT